MAMNAQASAQRYFATLRFTPWQEALDWAGAHNGAPSHVAAHWNLWSGAGAVARVGGLRCHSLGRKACVVSRTHCSAQ